LEGADPQTNHWPEVKKSTPSEDRNIYPGEGMILADNSENQTGEEK